MTDSTPRGPDTRMLDQLFDDFLEVIATGGTVDLESVYPDRPDLGDRVRETLELAQQVAVRRATRIPTLDGYEFLEVLGEGGMGTVYRAEQLGPIRREVAIKVVKPGVASPTVLRRFERERQSLAAMNHPGIARVFEAGTAADGSPFFVMELVSGIPINQYCDQRQLTIRQRLALCQQVCRAVQHAHQNGVIHRDLKPGNILVQEIDGEPEVKVIDFGLARAIEVGKTSLCTEQGQVLGTLEYMAPEQADTSAGVVDTRTDVYALGVLLHELVAGCLPMSAREIAALGLVDALHAIRDREPTRPSIRMTRHGQLALAAELRHTTTVELQRELQRDLDWVVLKAMANQPQQRYDSAVALADELGRYLDHRALVAGPPSTGYRLRKFVRRHRGRVLAVGSLLVAILVGGIGTLLGLLGEAHKGRIASNYLGMFDFARHRAELVRLNGPIATEKPAWPDHLEGIRAWIADAELLEAARSEVENARGGIGSRAGDAEIPPHARTFLAEILDGLSRDLGVFCTDRLPTMREWKHAYGLGGGSGSEPLTADDANRFAVFVDNSWDDMINDFATKPVGSMAPNTLGIHDLAGNVCEWVTDTDQKRVAKGGHFESKLAELGVGRHEEDPSVWNRDYPNEPKSLWWYVNARWVGLRVVREVSVKDSRN